MRSKEIGNWKSRGFCSDKFHYTNDNDYGEPYTPSWKRYFSDSIVVEKKSRVENGRTRSCVFLGKRYSRFNASRPKNVYPRGISWNRKREIIGAGPSDRRRRKRRVPGLQAVVSVRPDRSPARPSHRARFGNAALRSRHGLGGRRTRRRSPRMGSWYEFRSNA